MDRLLARPYEIRRVERLKACVTGLAEAQRDALLDFAASHSGSANAQLSDARLAEIERRTSNSKRKFMTLEESRAKLVRLSG